MWRLQRPELHRHILIGVVLPFVVEDLMAETIEEGLQAFVKNTVGGFRILPDLGG